MDQVPLQQLVHWLPSQSNGPNNVLDISSAVTVYFFSSFFLFMVYGGFCCEIVIWLFINQEQTFLLPSLSFSLRENDCWLDGLFVDIEL